MSMLAEVKSKQKWSDDPRNTRWANDKTKFGYTMLTKMGWSEGKGLGQNLSGEATHIKVKKRINNSGIGLKKPSDDEWISQQDDFNALLIQLNQGVNCNGVTNIKSLEDRVRASKKKILYTKFVKSKDLSNASSQDLAAIFGTRSKSAPVTPQISEDDSDAASVVSCPVADSNNEHGITTLHTGISIHDYFAMKMASIKQKSQKMSNVEEPAMSPAKNLPVNENHKKNKKQRNHDEDEQDEKKKKTKKKKKCRDKSDDEKLVESKDSNVISNTNSVTEMIKNKRKLLEKENDSVHIKFDLNRSDISEIKCDVKKSSKKKAHNDGKGNDPKIIECDAKLSKDKKRKRHYEESIVIESSDIEITDIKFYDGKGNNPKIIECDAKLSKDKKRKRHYEEPIIIESSDIEPTDIEFTDTNKKNSKKKKKKNKKVEKKE
ncbi:PIN2/TERF1-interacting telomerase inhibitor 1 [Hydra vulgaris]|uniref:PIN2/TERF1-interacting telomerase inhibitor 1 n=1 Tax=Hydra vulgaris TaxID=6087 RepID=UPI001F5FCDA8|nr:PIN2/TERF1-interacting telomerase inhibitor 1-like [Hydra vulgaris]